MTRHTPSPTANAQDVMATTASAAFPATALEGVEATVEPHVKAATDRIYEDIMLSVQDYLRDNVKYNIGQQIATAEREATYAYGRLRDVTEQRDALLTALTELADVFAHDGENSVARFDRLAAMFRKDTGYTAPGKDSAAGPVSQADRDGLNAIYDAWYLAKVTRARAAIAKATAA